jgi:hypothetical protein
LAQTGWQVLGDARFVVVKLFTGTLQQRSEVTVPSSMKKTAEFISPAAYPARRRLFGEVQQETRPHR